MAPKNRKVLTKKETGGIFPKLGLIGLLMVIPYKGKSLFESKTSIFLISQLSFFVLFTILNILGMSLNLWSINALSYLIILLLSIAYGSWSVSFLQN